MTKVSFSAIVNSKNVTVTMEDDPAWGKMQEVFTKCLIVDGHGGQTLQPMNFFDAILPAVVVSVEGEDIQFNTKSIVSWKEMSGKELTAILGEVISRLPLEIYSKNLKLGESPLLSMIQSTT